MNISEKAMKTILKIRMERRKEEEQIFENNFKIIEKNMDAGAVSYDNK